MNRGRFRTILVFISGMVTFAISYFIITTFINPKRPTMEGVIENWGKICFWYDDAGSITAAVSPEGCYSTTCTLPIQQVGSAIVNERDFTIALETRFVLEETSRFPLPCIENCEGGGSVIFDLGGLAVGDYEVRFRDKKVGELLIFSGRPTPRQCFENNQD